MPHTTIADFFARTLADAGVERIWGVTGDSLNGLNDSLRRLGRIDWMHVRHEEVAAFAAGAEAAVTGKLAVCAGSCGPGNLHLINGLFDCHRNRVPVLAIAAHIPSSEIGLSYFQETHPQDLFRECSHYVELVTNPQQFPRVLETAMNTAVRERGVSMIVLPGDIALKPHYETARQGLDDLAKPKSKDECIHPQRVAYLLDSLADDDAIFTTDVGTPTVWAARYLTMNGKRRLIGSFNHGSMANAMPQAIGAQAAFPGRQVISLSGDGGFTMLMGDVLSLKQLNLPVKVIVFNNASLGFVAMEMKAAGYLDTGTDLENPDFAIMARAIGIHGIRVERPADLERAIKETLAHDGPVVVDVVTAKQELVMPPKIQLEQAKGFSLYMLKAIINGRGDELVELGQTNLRR